MLQAGERPRVVPREQHSRRQMFPRLYASTLKCQSDLVRLEVSARIEWNPTVLLVLRRRARNSDLTDVPVHLRVLDKQHLAFPRTRGAVGRTEATRGWGVDSR